MVVKKGTTRGPYRTKRNLFFKGLRDEAELQAIIDHARKIEAEEKAKKEKGQASDGTK